MSERWKEICTKCGVGCIEVEALLDSKDIRGISCPYWKGLYVFNRLPDNYRPANEFDLVIKNKPLTGTKCLLKSFHSSRYESYTVKETTDAGWLRLFIMEGRCFVRK